MVIALQKRDLFVEQQKSIKVLFDGEVIGDYFADLFINEIVIVEIKVAEAIDAAHKAQLLNYLKATNSEAGPLFNFGPQPQFTRKVMSY